MFTEKIINKSKKQWESKKKTLFHQNVYLAVSDYLLPSKTFG